MLAFSLALLAAAATGAAPLSHCVFHEANQLVHRWEGGCGPLFGQEPKMRLKPAKAIGSGRWRSDTTPTAVWGGTMTDQGFDDADLELELYGTNGILRTAYGWYGVRSFVATGASMRFDVDTTSQIAPSPVDIEIIRRADALLSSVAVWNRADNRRCPGRATTWSIYCAMDRAAFDAACGTHHRRPAMEAVRAIIDERTASRNYDHRLMDYNNDSTTTLADVRSLFRTALAKLHGSSSDQPLGKPADCPPPVEPAVTVADTMIVSRAQTLLASPNAWNRHDADTTGSCPDGARTFALRCALKQASQDVTGEYNGGGPMMREARALIDSLPHAKYDARLIDYNNDPTTTFAALQAYFTILKGRLAKRIVN
jgi:hypothetical protein